MYRYHDMILSDPTPEMEAVLKRFNVIVHRPGRIIGIADTREEARKMIGKRVVFAKEVDPTFFSLARQKGTMFGILTVWINERNLQKIVEAVRLAIRFRVPVLIASGASTLQEIRSPHDRASIGIFLGLTREQAYWAVSRGWEILETP